MTFQCPIWGQIDVSDLCKKFILTPEMQRMRRIKQLGMTSEVFPSGTHTRFEHSLGVMYLSKKLWNTVFENVDEKYAEYEHYGELVELAGLLHDIGHGPKSHLFQESIYVNSDIKFSHEKQSQRLIRKINNRIKALSEEELKIVCAMITGKPRENYPSFMFEIVANPMFAGLDTDKMDYLLRDAHHLGEQAAGYKPVEIKDIILTARILQNNENIHIAYSESVKEKIRFLFNTRLSMYSRIYFHPEVKNVDRIMLCVMSQINFNINNLDEFIKYDDAYVNYHMRNCINHEGAALLDTQMYNAHNCKSCPKKMLKRKAEASGDTKNKDPASEILYY